MELFYYILCRKAEEDLDHLIWDCQNARAVRSYFLQEFDVRIVGQKDVCAIVREFLLHSPFREKGWFLWFAGVCAMLWDIWRERNNRVFCGRDRDPYEVQSLVRFHVLLCASISNFFIIILLTRYYLVGIPLFRRGVLVDLFFCMPCIL